MSAPDVEVERFLADGPPGEPLEERKVFAELHDALFGGQTSPVTLSRYVVLERIAAGGLGVVYAGFDPQLDRKVAIKLLHSQPRGVPVAETHARLLREARVLARLTHPNVVHRDFKPANVLVGDDGRARVLDFGLARALAPATPQPRLEAPPLSGDVEPGRLTQSGAVLGTPAYMAPEQHAGGTSDERTDCFAIFAALYEAIYGTLPFPASELSKLAADKQAGRIAVPPRGRSCPAALHRAIVRGLSPDPAQRFVTIADALVELRRVQHGWRRRMPWIVAGGAVVTAAAVVFGAPTSDPCLAEADKLQGVWDDDVRTAVREGLTRTDVPFATATVGSVERALDAYADRLVGARVAACRASETDADAVLRTQRCLDRRRARLRALTQLLQEADPRLAERAVDAVSSLPPISVCTLASATVGESAGAAELDEAIASAEALRDAGRFREGAVAAQRAVEVAARRDDPAATARAHRILGRLHADAGDAEAAERALQTAWLTAERVGLMDAAAQALVDLVGVIVQSRARYDEGERLAELAAARLSYRGLRDELDARLALEVGRLRHAQGRHEEAFAALADALSLALEVWGEGHPRVADVLNERGNSLDRQGRYDEAMADYERALVIRRDLLGAEHPRVGASLNNIANIHASLGRREQALETYGEALAIYEGAYGPEHPRVAAVINNIAIVHNQLGRSEEALREHRRALAIRERTLPPDHPLLALDHNNIGSVLAKLGRREEALAEYETALDIRERRLGEEHPDVAFTLDNLAVTLGQLGRMDEAIAASRRALAIREEVFGEAHPDVATSLVTLGGLLQRPDERKEALVLVRRALKIRTTVLGPDHPSVAQAQKLLATLEPL